ncbi:hypothetical protein [Bacillus licheniformis]|uniref:hypothetical protein n=1 Tax=Bacillus licheniformis TaxID=1402 RepID=UPI00030B82B6|nr:hypothetical protein [Bacillus licheniformis]MED0688679.1 hypothetical protein [Bacillus licheniformis]MED0713095.1 hypothetical protein [Bacillus licheniformis]MED0791082.1 hypothetical protein [Bacillus licheniformis]OLF98124.1 hypothetical protein B4089_0413 [Bacillus licheniformis]TWM08112.1 hypothetical protein CHCC15091_0477 [Bacillus licheniformis]
MFLTNINWEKVNWSKIAEFISSIFSSYAEFITSILNSKFITSAITSWPLAIVIVAFAFRKGILDILKNRKFTLSGGGGSFSLTVGAKIETAKDNLNEAPIRGYMENKNLIDIPGITMSKDYKELEFMMMDPLPDPTKSITNTWNLFATDFGKIVDFISEKTDLSFEGDSLHVMDVLYENKKVSKPTVNAIKALFEIFQLAEDKSTNKDIDKVEFANKVRDYYKLCVDALERMRSELSETLVKDLQS